MTGAEEIKKALVEEHQSIEKMYLDGELTYDVYKRLRAEAEAETQLALQELAFEEFMAVDIGG